MSAHLPEINALPGSVTTKFCPAKGPDAQSSLKTGNAEMFKTGGLLGPALDMPILRGALTECLPTFGVSWQVPQKPGMLGTPSTSLRPATPVMLICVALKTASPRATDLRSPLRPAVPGRLLQA